MVTGATAEAAGAGLIFREIDRVRVKGKTEPVALFELLAAAPAAPADLERADLFARGLAAYRSRRFNEALESFDDALLAAHPGDGPAEVLRARCRRYRFETPGAGLGCGGDAGLETGPVSEKRRRMGAVPAVEPPPSPRLPPTQHPWRSRLRL